MNGKDGKTPAYYRRQAKQLRERAARAPNSEWHEIYEQIAKDYEALAEAMERGSKTG